MLKITYETFEKISEQPDVVAGFTHRHGGVSKGGFGSLNLNIHVEIDNENAWKNINRFIDSLGEYFYSVFAAKQIHSGDVEVIKSLENFSSDINIIKNMVKNNV